MLGDVEWIEDVRPRQPANAGASAAAQGRDERGDQPIWDHGIHNEVDVVGAFDRGTPTIDHDFFRDPALGWAGSHRMVLEIRALDGAALDYHATQVAGWAIGATSTGRVRTQNRGGAWAATMAYADFGSFGTHPDNRAAVHWAVAGTGARV